MRTETKCEIGSPAVPIAGDLSDIARQGASILSPIPYVRGPGPVGMPKLGGGSVAGARRRSPRGLARWATLLARVCVGIAALYWIMLPPSVAVVAPRRGPAVQAVYATGTVEPTVMVPIAARTEIGRAHAL